MKKLLALGIWLFVPASFAQTWENYANTDGESRYYDPYRRVMMSGIAFIWDLHDLKAEASEGGQVYRSVLYPTEYNCRSAKKRVLSTHKMADKMGRGELVAETTQTGYWIDVQPDMPDSRLMFAACNAR